MLPWWTYEGSLVRVRSHGMVRTELRWPTYEAIKMRGRGIAA
jgi:hypothetical protein